MASNSIECEARSEVHNSEKGLVFHHPCGHYCCIKCVDRNIASGNRCCPRCKQDIGNQVDSPPITNASMPPPQNPTPETRKIPADLCESHKLKLEYFCVMCGDIICRTCAKKTHAQHRVEVIKDIVDRSEISCQFIHDLDDKIQTKLDSLSNHLSIINEIFEARNVSSGNEEDLLRYKNLFQSRITSITQDLHTWKDKIPKSSEEKRKIFKKLAQYWTDQENGLDCEMVPSSDMNLDEVAEAFSKIVNVAQRP